ncbi:MAG: protease inhibitor I42 family protein [Candidatus Zixiibacteriota bacterium]|nr:MAG: protease inhibitor I42 family protein [candidate division Zixibacteria bacterium]
MNSRNISTLLLLVFAVACIACSSENADPPIYTGLTDTVRVTAGDQFKIVLESNITTGFSWQFATTLDSTALRLVEHDYVPLPNPDKLLGRGGHEHWLFEALDEGSTAIALQYLRPWDSTSVAKEANFTVEISK